MPNKPKKLRYKFFLADSKGRTYDFISYTGKIQPFDDPVVPDLKSNANSLLHLPQAITFHHNHLLYFNNWFTSIPLMNHLATREIWCCGTIRVPRIPGINKQKLTARIL